MPPEYRARLRTLLPYVELNPVVADLVYVTRDATGAVIGAPVPVQNRPWEWTEYLGDAPGDQLAPMNLGTDRPTVRNSAALSLELFDARVTSDHVIVPALRPRTEPASAATAGDGVDLLAEETLRSIQDDVYAEGPFRRDWRETRVSPGVDGDATGSASGSGEQDPPLPALTSAGMYGEASGMNHHPSSRRPSPASSIRSVGSGGMRQSPAHPLSRLSVSTSGEVIDVDAFDGGTSGTGSSAHKRKAMSTIAEDDEIELVAGPVSAKRGSKAAKTAGKTTKKRR